MKDKELIARTIINNIDPEHYYNWSILMGENTEEKLKQYLQNLYEKYNLNNEIDQLINQNIKYIKMFEKNEDIPLDEYNKFIECFRKFRKKILHI